MNDDLRRHANHLMLQIQDLNARGPAAEDPPLIPGMVPMARYRWGEWWEPEESLFGPIPFEGRFPASGMMVAGHVYDLT